MSLTFDELRVKNVARSTGKTGFNHPMDSWNLMEWGAALTGEVGEALNKAKKIARLQQGIRGNKEAETLESLKADFADELPDIQIYLDLWAAAGGVDLGRATISKFNRKSIEIGCGIML